MSDRSKDISPIAARTDHQGVQRLADMADSVAWVFRRWLKRRSRRSEDRALWALATLGDDRLSDLSEAGQQLRRKMLQQIRAREPRAPWQPRLPNERAQAEASARRTLESIQQSW
jgi:hypothetical protein